MPQYINDPELLSQLDAPTKALPKTRTPEEFAKVYGPAADRAGKALGVDPSMLLGQWGLETGWGKSVVPGTNNLGNIKDFAGGGVAATDNMTGSKDKYRAYDSPEAFADDFASLIQRKYPRAVGAKDPLSFATALKEGGYAEDPKYVDKVVLASRMAGTKQNPVLKAVGSAVEAIIPSAQAAERQYIQDPEVLAQLEASEEPAKGKGVIETVKGGVRAVQQYQKDRVGGLIRGAGSIGATLIRPFESAKENEDRRKSIDQGLQSLLGVDPTSVAYQGEKLGAEIAGTAGAGGVVGNALRLGSRLPAVGNALNKLATSTSSAGMTVGPGGGVATNTLARIAGGGLSGGATAGLVNPGDVGMGAGIGAALPPGLNVAARLGGGAVGAYRGIRDMATGAGQNRIAEQIMRSSATNPQAAAASLAGAREVVPGSAPTVGQAAADPGLAQLERTLLNNPEMAPALQARYAQQRAARGAAIDDVAATAPGSGSYYDDIQEGRRIFANEDYAAARNAGVDPEMAASMQPEIASLMERPSIQAAVADARRLAAETGENITDMGSVQGLDWVKKALDNQISRANRGNTSIGAEDLRALTQTRNDLNATLEQLAPAYREANRNYAAMSRQVNSMDVARNLDRAYSPVASNFGISAKENGNAFMKALRGAQDSVRGATGRNMDIGDAMSTPDIFALENVGRDLARVQYGQSAGAATGSPTAQNLMSQNMIRQIMQGAGLPAEAAAGNTLLNTMLRPVQWVGRLAEPRVQARLVELQLSPEQAARALRTLPPAQAQALAVNLGLERAARTAPAISAD